MENAVKALLIAAGVLIGVMIITLGVALYSSLGEYVESVQEETRSKELQQFNEPYIKYINYNETTHEIEFSLTIQDVVTAANTARQSNLNYNLTEQDGNNYYVTINLLPGNNQLEKNIGLNSAEILEKGLGQKYKCSSKDVKINPQTGRVYEVNFHVLP